MTDSILPLDTETLEDMRDLADGKKSDDFGMREIAYYIDSFKTPTDVTYFRNKRHIQGTFTNSAAQASSLNVFFDR